MNEAELFGGVLYTASDPVSAAKTLSLLLKSPQTDHELAAQAGLDPVLVDSLRLLEIADDSKIEIACALGAAWVSGRRSAPKVEMWETVASLPSHFVLPNRLDRTTTETLIGLANSAQLSLRLAVPYMDIEGVGYLEDSIVAATLRSVQVRLIRPVSGTREDESVDHLLESVREFGDLRTFAILNPVKGTPFPHLKVMTVDGSTAYIGSANLTGAALAGRNLEFGVLVHGEQVRVLDDYLDLYTR